MPVDMSAPDTFASLPTLDLIRRVCPTLGINVPENENFKVSPLDRWLRICYTVNVYCNRLQ